ncbi:WXG100 family type VII secretion target [Aeromicrobium sp.]|uniref:WXG100 family type VII secretion target n=1 Tax=Aeromicrobium sp. TaxID=1871063 RepID=UPI0019946EF6|nr:WXG100 family type VII secretion target [Aeromicrobium sp.]MBC7630361.1 WXG100 family type VII secretion target [Aeromicrobium sp.]
MNAGELKVNFGGLETAASDIQGSANQIEARVDELESQLSNLRANWTGSASESYQVSKAKWDAAIRDMKLLLTEIGTAVQQSNGDYRATEASNTSRWG